MRPLLHTRTKMQLDNFLKQPSHGVLLIGEDGIGKYYVATWLARQLSDEQITLLPAEDKTTISIDQIRELYAITKTGSSLTIIIKDAQIMRSEAQSAFLKLLEEPPKNTYFILTASSSSSILETIRSRCQKIEILTPPKNDLLRLAESNMTGIEASQYNAFLHSTKGLPGAFFTLLDSQPSAEIHKKLLSEAKLFYSGSQYDRYVLCASHNYQKDWAVQLLSILSTIVSSLMRQSNKSSFVRQRILTQADLLQTTTQAVIKHNANVKIQLTHLVENL